MNLKETVIDNEEIFEWWGEFLKVQPLSNASRFQMFREAGYSLNTTNSGSESLEMFFGV